MRLLIGYSLAVSRLVVVLTVECYVVPPLPFSTVIATALIDNSARLGAVSRRRKQQLATYPSESEQASNPSRAWRFLRVARLDVEAAHASSFGSKYLLEDSNGRKQPREQGTLPE